VVGAAFAVLGGVLWWRQHPIAAVTAGTLGAGLMLAALALPTWLGPVHRGWMGLAQVLSKVTTPLFLGLVYYGIMTPFGWLLRAFGRNPLVRPSADGGYWVARAPGVGPRSDLTRQF
jgi:hypothetical protein